MAPLAAPPAQPAPATRRRSRAKPKPPRQRIVVRPSCGACGGLVLEQALLDGDRRAAGEPGGVGQPAGRGARRRGRRHAAPTTAS